MLPPPSVSRMTNSIPYTGTEPYSIQLILIVIIQNESKAFVGIQHGNYDSWSRGIYLDASVTYCFVTSGAIRQFL